ncbi:MAG: ABC transporter permease [Anaerolineae bacterium]|jgi:ABC-2 type transport system permease protein|nr:ABC transporter permease [Anaerolineae bacterium]
MTALRNIWRVFSHEFITTVTRVSFIVGLVLVAVGGAAVFFISNSMSGNAINELIASIFVPQFETGVEGYIDHSGIIQQLPEGMDDWLIAYPDEADALAALEQDTITGYYIIAEDWLTSGAIEYVRRDANPFGSLEESNRIQFALKANLLGNDAGQASRIEYPLNLVVRQVSAPGATGESAVEEEVSSADAMTAFWIPYVVIFLFYMILMGSSTMMLNSVSTEKSNRMTEILITSLHPAQLLIGKMMGLGLAGLLQTVVWSGTGLLLMGYSERAGVLPESLSLPPMLLVWLVVFFVLGYAVYGSLMASLGALTASSKEAGQVTIIVIFPLILPMMLISSITMEPNGIIATVLSLIPFTAPVVMPARLAIISVPWWQILTAMALLVGLVAFIIRSAANLFHAQNLLSGDSVNIGNFLKAMLGLKYKAKVD